MDRYCCAIAVRWQPGRAQGVLLNFFHILRVAGSISRPAQSAAELETHGISKHTTRFCSEANSER